MNTRRILAAALAILNVWSLHAAAYDLVLMNGRVMDPESGMDAVRNVGIEDGVIKTISKKKLDGDRIIDCTGLVVAPGFIDLHAHGMNDESGRLQAADGVTTQLELEAGVYPVGKWLASREGTARIHYGATSGHIAARISAMHGIGVGHAPTAPDSARQAIASPDYAYQRADDRQLEAIVDQLERGLHEGALGIGIGLQYTPAAERDEIFRVFQLAARYDAPVFVHIRSSAAQGSDGSMPAIHEVVSCAAGTGAPLHIVHLNSSGGVWAPTAMELILGARERGLDITTETYPYTAASTRLESALFDEGWQARDGITYGDLEWPATGERLTEETFKKYREEGGWVVIHKMSEELISWAVGHPEILIASDGVPFVDGRAHPRGAGTFARVLGRYVREQQVIGLMDALAKITLRPAQRLEPLAPALKKKGRVQEGADADITVFDPDTILDRATFQEPAVPSEGIPYVIVSGTPVIDDGALVDDAFPGRPIRSRLAD